jgi:MATE family multidrug resistance protein
VPIVALTGLRHIVALALPVVIAELGWFAMAVVDTIMVGPLGAPAIAAVSIGTAVYDIVAFAGIGLLLGLDTTVSQSFGAGRIGECRRWLWQGLYLVLVLSAAGVPAIAAVLRGLPRLGLHPSVLALAVPYVGALKWSIPPLLLYAALRRYLQGMGLVRPVMLALLSANVLNAAGNWLLLPHYGVAGIGWSTVIARIYLALVLAGAAVLDDRSVVRVMRPAWESIRRLLSLGAPAAGQLLLEIGVFATATALAGRIGNPQALAAHHVALNIAATTFMVPLGVSSAGAVVVGHAIGARDPAGARRAGWLSLALGAGFMLAAAIAVSAAPGAFVGIFTREAAVLDLAIPLMYVAAMFQVFDGVQVVATGVLRGTGDTRTPMLANLAAHWAIGLPAGYVLCFPLGLGVRGLWLGLCAGLMAVGSFLLFWWRAAAERGGR